MWTVTCRSVSMGCILLRMSARFRLSNHYFSWTCVGVLGKVGHGICEIGARDITTVQNIMKGYDFYHIIPDNFYRWAGIYVHSCIVMDELKIFFIVGGLYRHPNENAKQSVYDIEVSLDKIPDGISAILAGDMNITPSRMIMRKLCNIWLPYNPVDLYLI